MSRSHYIEEARARLLAGLGSPERVAFVPDEFQREAVSSVMNDEDTLVVAPTGAGKTYIAFEAIAASLALRQRAVYTTPLKALSNSKYAELKLRFEPQYSAGLLTGDRKIDTNADVVVATTEIYRNELYGTAERYALVVLDEVHFIGDPQRGPVWEEAIILTPRSTTLLMLSASISNATEIADWLSEVRGKPCRIVHKRDRPVELRYGFIHPELGVLPLFDEKQGVFREVAQFYAGIGLDSSGMRLRRPRRGGAGRDDHADRRGGKRGHRTGRKRG